METLKQQQKLNPHYIIQQSTLNTYYQSMDNNPRSVYELIEKRYAKQEQQLQTGLNIVSCLAVGEDCEQPQDCCVCGSCPTLMQLYKCPNCQTPICSSMCSEKHRYKCNRYK